MGVRYNVLGVGGLSSRAPIKPAIALCDAGGSFKSVSIGRHKDLENDPPFEGTPSLKVGSTDDTRNLPCTYHAFSSILFLARPAKSSKNSENCVIMMTAAGGTVRGSSTLVLLRSGHQIRRSNR